MPLRPATTDDVTQIAALHVASWRDAYRSILDPAFLAGPVEQDRLDVWRARLNGPAGNQHVIVAIGAGALVGFVCVFGAEDPKWGACVDNLHVASLTRGQGVGAALLRAAASWVRENYPDSGLYLWVFETNARAREFYENLGGRIVEKTLSRIPSAADASILRIHWPADAALSDRGRA
jgi:ribosomal protein S18 acetylase RimI-like enzyme